MAGISCIIFLKSGLYYPKFPWLFNFCARGTGQSLCLSGRQLSLEALPPSIVMPFLCSALFALVSWSNRYIYYAAKGNQQSNRMTIPGPLTTSLLQEEYQFSLCSINCGQFHRKKMVFIHRFSRFGPVICSSVLWCEIISFAIICVWVISETSQGLVFLLHHWFVMIVLFSNNHSLETFSITTS